MESKKQKNHKSKIVDRAKCQEILEKSVMSNAGYAFERFFRESNTFFVRLMWLLSLLLTSGLCFYLISKTVANYLKYEVVTKLNVIYEDPSIFPTITLCNLDPFKSNYSDQDLDFFIRKNLSFLEFGNNSNIYRYYYMSNLHEMLKNNTIRSNGLVVMNCFINFGTDCNFDYEHVNYFDFFYGNCLQYNSNETKKIYKRGKLSGISLEIYAESSLSRPWINAAGIHLFIHNKSDRISLFQGIDAPVGKATNIAINRVVTNKLERPYSECVEDLSDSIYYHKLKAAGYSYRRSDCIDLCFSVFAYQTCGCYEGSTKQFFSDPICKTVNETNCLGKALTDFTSHYNSECNCPLECHSISYMTTTSSADFPTLPYRNLISSLSNISLELNEWKTRLLQLNIYFDDLRYTVIDEIKKVELVDLISNCGGIFILFVYMKFYFEHFLIVSFEN